MLNESQRVEFWRVILKHNVLRFIAHIKERGGVKPEEWSWLLNDEDSSDYPLGIIMRADEYLIFPKYLEALEKSMLVLVKTLAIMSFIPGGVSFLGFRFCSEIDGFVELEYGTEKT